MRRKRDVGTEPEEGQHLKGRREQKDHEKIEKEGESLTIQPRAASIPQRGRPGTAGAATRLNKIIEKYLRIKDK